MKESSELGVLYSTIFVSLGEFRRIGTHAYMCLTPRHIIITAMKPHLTLPPPPLILTQLQFPFTQFKLCASSEELLVVLFLSA